VLDSAANAAARGQTAWFAEALERQDLFINQSVATFALQLLWQFIREGGLNIHGYFINLETGKVKPLPIKRLMTITEIIMGQPECQFENDDPKGKVTTIKWVIIFADGKVYYQTELLWPTANPKQMPKLPDVQLHIDEHPNTVKPTIATSGPRGLGFTFLTGKNDRRFKDLL